MAGLTGKTSEEAIETVNIRRKHGTLPFPDFTPNDIDEFENKLEYPGPGSASHKKQ
jgi:hypothetical protein